MKYATNQKNLRVFIINLSDHKEKKIRMKKILKKFDFKYEFFNAFDGRNSSINDYDGYNDLSRKLFLGRSLFPGELGAFESNRLLMKKIINEDIKMALILEDDIKFEADFDEYLSKIIRIDYKWDVVRFIARKKILNLKGRKVIELDKKTFLMRFPKLLGETHAYLISKDGAKKILASTRNFYHQFDILMGQTWKTNLNCLYCVPGLVGQVPELNIIAKNHPRFQKKKKSIFSIYFFTRFFFKIYEAVAKWFHYLYFLLPDLFHFNKSKKIK